MKTIFLMSAICLVMLCGCYNVPSIATNEIPEYSVITIDDCEYIQVVNGYTTANNYSYAITHKGNCKNPIHGRQK